MSADLDNSYLSHTHIYSSCITYQSLAFLSVENRGRVGPSVIHKALLLLTFCSHRAS